MGRDASQALTRIVDVTKADSSSTAAPGEQHPQNVANQLLLNHAQIEGEGGQGFFGDDASLAVQEGALSLAGWALDVKNKSPSERVWVIVNGLAPLPLLSFTGKVAREDVVEHFEGDKSYLSSGWKARFSLKDLRPGLYSLSVYAETANGWLYPLVPAGSTKSEIFVPG